MKLLKLKMKMNMSLMLLVFPVLLGVLPLPAQDRTAQLPFLRVRGGEKLQPLSLSKLDVDVRISGFIAETKMTMTFHNPNDRVLEGEFCFPLPQGAGVSGYALDVNGIMVDGVAVEKQKGREVFEEIVRQGIDPGLVEMVKGNNFRTKIYPILPYNSRTISVRYLSELIYRDKEVFFQLPLDFENKVKNFSIRVEVIKAVLKPVITKCVFANFEFSRWQDSYVAETRLKDYVPGQNLVVLLPQVDTKKVHVEKGPDGEYYFSVFDLFPLPEGMKKPGIRIPDHITILWDASGSRSKNDQKRELQFLEVFFKRQRSKKIKVDLVCFRGRREEPKRFVVRRGNCQELIKAIKEVDYDGGTQIGVISPLKKGKVPALYMLFSDGISNFGKEKPGGFKAPLYIFSSSSSANHCFLDYLARQTGGIYFNLNRVDDESILENIGRSPFSFISASSANGEFCETFPAYSQPLSGPFVLTGKLTAQKGNLILNYGINGKILRKVSVMVKREDAKAGNLLRTFWAQKKAAELQLFAKENREELIDLGKKYGLVTPYTSLIVLESLAQYIEHEIKPPETLPQMRKQYEKTMAAREKQRKKEQANKIKNVLSLWKERVEWWNKKFVLPEKKETENKEESRHTAGRARQESSATAARRINRHRPGQENRENITRQASNIVVIGVQPGDESIYGKVVLPDGTVIPGAAVIITGDTIRKRVTVTSEEGNFRFPSLPTGNYQLRFELEGFKTVIHNNIDVSPGKKVMLEVPMEVANIQEEILVTAQAPVVDVRKTTVASRDPWAVIKRVPGVTLDREGVGGNDPRQQSAFYGLDADDDDTTWYVDGASIKDPSAIGAVPSYLNANAYGKGPVGRDASAGIRLKAWNPGAPYLEEITKAGVKDAFSVYLEQKKTYGNSPGFYLDCSDYFFGQKQKDLGLQVLSNIAEMKLESAALLRILGYRLAQLGFIKLSASVFEKVLELRPEEPQSFRDLALVLARQGKYKRAVELLYHVVMNHWDNRFQEIEVIALTEINRIIARAKRQGHDTRKIADAVDQRLIKLLDVDIRIVLTWDGDSTDIDLWVIEPTGEKAYYSNKRTRIGGLVSDDFTEGYGPEEYLLKKAVPGQYRIMANYFGSSAARILGPVTLQVDIFTDYGRENEKRKSITLRLGKQKDTLTVGEIEL